MIKEILFVPHSHTDIGYTHPQPVILELHRRFLEQALDMTEETAERSDGSAFKWMVEVTGTAIDFWRRASGSERDRFVRATQEGRVEVAAMRWNQAQLSDHHMLIEAMSTAEELREAGIPIRHAMNTDVNGLNWGVVDILSDNGIETMSMAINEHFGYAVRPRPQAFNWRSASGRQVLVYNGLMYGVTVSSWLGIPHDPERTRRAVPRLAELLEQRGYPHDLLIMQATNVHIHDNAPPNPALPDYIRQFNAESEGIKLRIATMSEAFAALKTEDLVAIPTLTGDWPDWWTFGSGSTARETAVALSGQRALRDAQQVLSWRAEREPRSRDLERESAEALALYVEHTYTSDSAAKKPDNLESLNQIHWKKNLAYEGLSLARMLRRDGLHHLASRHAGDEPAGLFYNPLPFPVSRSVRIPRTDLTQVLLEPWSNMLQRQDKIFGEALDEETVSVALDLPALGYAIVPQSAFRSRPGRLEASEGHLENEHVEVRFDSISGGVASLLVDGIERISNWDFRFGVPVLESPETGFRTAIYGPPRFADLEHALDLHQDWHTDWIACRQAATLKEARVRHGKGHCEVIQDFAHSNGEGVSVIYRLSAGEAGLTIETVVNKKRITTPHAHYLPLPLALSEGWTTHYETAGASVELDREQLTGGNRHFVTTQRYLRMQDQGHGVTFATPDLPLFQVGGFTFGRHVGGEVKREHPVLLAWLNNNYWDTNFEVSQSGPLRSRLHMVSHQSEPLSRSIARALPFVVEPQYHIMRSAGPASASLIEVNTDGLLITGVERSDQTLRLFVLNPDDETRTLRLGKAALTPRKAKQIQLNGAAVDDCPVINCALSLAVAGRDWVGLEIEVI